MTLNSLLSPLSLSLHSLAVAVGLLLYMLTSRSLRQRRAPTAAISWVLTIALVPYVGLPLYLLFGTRKLRHAETRVAARTLTGTTGEPDWLCQLTAAMGQPPAVTYRNLHVHADGAEALQALWDVIGGAKRELVLCTFLIGRDAMGRALVTRLIEKARAGVSIRLMIDGVGRVMGGGLNLRKLKAAGVTVALYGPILHMPFRSSVNLRNHRKMVIADAARLWCGGRNFAAEYFEGARRRAPWRDLTFDLEGPVAAQAHELFEQDWAFAIKTPAPPLEEFAPIQHTAKQTFAQVIASGPDQTYDTVHDLLVTACFKARHRIVAVTPYFVPGDMLQTALMLAARRGVAVDLILPRRSNHKLADFARHRALRDLAAAGGCVWLVAYMVHAKCVVIDEDLALSGSANLDARSLFLNYELMVAFYAATDVRHFAAYVDKHRESADRYAVRKPSLLRDLMEGLVLWLAFQL
jgi:cardiolipin synthase